MTKKLISILIANLFVAAPAYAADDFKLTGSVSLGGIYNDEDAVDPSKMNEYRDLSNGALFGWDVKGRGSKYWLDFFGENIGRDDQYINLKGGAYGAFKYRVYSDSLTHNFLEGGKTPYSGAGTSAHRADLPSLDVSKWNSVNLGYDRRDDGGYFEFSGGSPWFIRLDGNQVSQSGTKIAAGSNGLSPTYGFVDLAVPTEYTTKNWTVEGGYGTKTMLFTVNWTTSKFENDNKTVTWNNRYFNNGIDTTYLGEDNKYERLALNGTIRQLPLNSTFAIRYTKDELKSDVPVGATVLGVAVGAPAGTAASLLPTGANTSTFNGKVDNETLTLGLASTPTKGLDTRLYFNSFKREDDSTHMVFSSRVVTGPAGTAPVTEYVNEPYSYEKTNWGIDAFYRINRQNRVGAGYDYLEMDRKDERYDYNTSKDKVWWIEWKTSMLENVSARVKYSNLDRTSEFKLGNSGTGPTDPNYMYRFQSAFDAGPLNQDKWKFTVDASPMEFLDLSAEVNFKNNDYQNVVLGRSKDERRELYGMVSYGDPSAWRMTLFGDYEKVEYQAKHRVVSGGSYDPSAPDTASSYNWSGSNRDQNYAYGFSLDVPATEKFKVSASIMRYKTDGQIDFAAPSTIAAASYPVPVGAYDDSTRTAINLKGVYAFSKTLSLTAGYAYEKYDYQDAQYQGYQYTSPNAVPGPSYNANYTAYYMGYYKDPNYKANIFYGWLTYKF